MTLKQGVVVVVALIVIAVVTRIIADVLDIPRTEAGWLTVLMVGILGLAWRRWHSRVAKPPQ